MGGTLSAMDRCLGQVFNTHRSVAGVYSSNTFGAMAGALLVTFLFGTALGAAIYQRVARRNTEQMLSLLLATTAFFCLLSIYPLGYIDPLYSRLEEVFGNSFHGAVIAEISLCLSIFLLPTCSMGAAFSHLAQSVKRTDRGVGRALCLNTMGGAIAPLLFAVLLLPRIGLQYALLAIPLGYLLCRPQTTAHYQSRGYRILCQSQNTLNYA